MVSAAFAPGLIASSSPKVSVGGNSGACCVFLVSFSCLYCVFRVPLLCFSRVFSCLSRVVVVSFSCLSPVFLAFFVCLSRLSRVVVVSLWWLCGVLFVSLWCVSCHYYSVFLKCFFCVLPYLSCPSCLFSLPFLHRLFVLVLFLCSSRTFPLLFCVFLLLFGAFLVSLLCLSCFFFMSFLCFLMSFLRPSSLLPCRYCSPPLIESETHSYFALSLSVFFLSASFFLYISLFSTTQTPHDYSTASPHSSSLSPSATTVGVPLDLRARVWMLYSNADNDRYGHEDDYGNVTIQ